MHHMIPLVDAEALSRGLTAGGLSYESAEETTDSTVQFVFRDSQTGGCYMFTAEYETEEDGLTSYGFETIATEGSEFVQVTPVVKQTQTVTRWVPYMAPSTGEAEEAEQS